MHRNQFSLLPAPFVACSVIRAWIHSVMDEQCWCPSPKFNMPCHAVLVHRHWNITCLMSSSIPQIEQHGSTSICRLLRFIRTASALDIIFHIKFFTFGQISACQMFLHAVFGLISGSPDQPPRHLDLVSLCDRQILPLPGHLRYMAILVHPFLSLVPL